MNEAHFREIEATLLYVSEARERAERGAGAIRRDGRSADAAPHLVEALERAERELAALHRRLMQGTYFAVPDEQLSMATSPVDRTARDGRASPPGG